MLEKSVDLIPVKQFFRLLELIEKTLFCIFTGHFLDFFFDAFNKRLDS